MRRRIDTLLDAPGKRGQVALGSLAIGGITAHFPRQPQLARPEAGRPLDVFRAWPDPVLTGLAREFIAKCDNISIELAGHSGQRIVELLAQRQPVDLIQFDGTEGFGNHLFGHNNS